MTIQVIGFIEFEYWAENSVEYDSFFNYVLFGLAAFGICICSCLLLVYKAGIEEVVTNMKTKMWKLKNKDKDYVLENAPGMYEMVRSA